MDLCIPEESTGSCANLSRLSTKPFLLDSDARQDVVLSQPQGDQERVVAYYSKDLLPQDSQGTARCWESLETFYREHILGQNSVWEEGSEVIIQTANQSNFSHTIGGSKKG